MFFPLASELFLNPRTYKGGGGSVAATPLCGFSEFFFLDDKTFAPVVFSSCSFISRAHFETS